MIFEPDADAVAYEQGLRDRAAKLGMILHGYMQWRAQLRATYKRSLAFERQRSRVIPPRMVAALAGAL